MEFKINDYLVKQEAISIAEEADRIEHFTSQCAEDYIYETCNGHELTIYTYKALLLCAECDTTHGEDYTDSIGEAYKSLADHACAVAHGTLLGACFDALAELRGAE